MHFFIVINYKIIIFFQAKQGIIKKCYVHLERLPDHMIKKCSIKVDMKYLFSSQETLKFDEMKIEHDDLDEDILKDIVSLFCL